MLAISTSAVSQEQSERRAIHVLLSQKQDDELARAAGQSPRKRKQLFSHFLFPRLKINVFTK